MRHERRIAFALTAVLSLGCTTAYEARLSGPSIAGPSGRSEIEHCLASLGFRDRSGDEFWAESIAAEPELVAIWEPERGSAWSPPPFATASLRMHGDGWSVGLVPSNGRGDDAKFFADALAKCLALHSPSTVVEIESQRFIDLR